MLLHHVDIFEVRRVNDERVVEITLNPLARSDRVVVEDFKLEADESMRIVSIVDETGFSSVVSL